MNAEFAAILQQQALWTCRHETRQVAGGTTLVDHCDDRAWRVGLQ